MTPTAVAYLITRVLDTPFWGIFNLLPFILYKDLHVTPFQLAFMIALKPTTALFSSYWTHHHGQSSPRFARTIAVARRLAFLPFFLFPLIDNAWYVIASFGLFMFFQSGMMPLWMELLAEQVSKEKRESIFSYAQTFGYLGAGILPFLLGWVLDEWEGAWRWLFVGAASLGLTAEFWLRRVPAQTSNRILTPPSHPLLRPWKQAWKLLSFRRDYARFQINFMLLGSGLMILQPALPAFFIDRLNLSYVEMGVAITLCKGIGFACGSPLWLSWIRKVDLFKLGALISLLAVTFPILLLTAQYEYLFIYLCYLIYGVMQSGNELSWNMSGPIFAGKESSAPYSSINVIAVGLRGVIIPPLGAYLLADFGPVSAIIASSLLCLFAMQRMFLDSSSSRENTCFLGAP